MLFDFLADLKILDLGKVDSPLIWRLDWPDRPNFVHVTDATISQETSQMRLREFRFRSLAPLKQVRQIKMYSMKFVKSIVSVNANENYWNRLRLQEYDRWWIARLGKPLKFFRCMFHGWSLEGVSLEELQQLLIFTGVRGSDLQTNFTFCQLGF